jgi:hypothetical protein
LSGPSQDAANAPIQVRAASAALPAQAPAAGSQIGLRAAGRSQSAKAAQPSKPRINRRQAFFRFLILVGVGLLAGLVDMLIGIYPLLSIATVIGLLVSNFRSKAPWRMVQFHLDSLAFWIGGLFIGDGGAAIILWLASAVIGSIVLSFAKK